MADEHEDKIQSTGREANGAKPLAASNDDVKPERYPSVRHDDAVEVAKQEGFEGPQGDPAEGKP